MVSGLRVLWRALVHIWDESMLMIKANVVWFVGSLPLYLLTVFACGIFVPAMEADSEPTIWPWFLAGMLLILVPSPMSAGVYAVANFVTHEEAPEFSMFWQGVRRFWKRTLLMYVIGGGVLGGLIFNTSFYMGMDGLWQAVAILWLYAIIYWLSLQTYLLPLLLTAAIPPPPPPTGDDGWPVDEASGRPARLRRAPPEPPTPEDPSLGTLYKRAAILALANPFFTLVLLFGVFVTLLLSSFALPVYPLLAMSFVALIGCRGLRSLREKYFPTEARGATG